MPVAPTVSAWDAIQDHAPKPKLPIEKLYGQCGARLSGGRLVVSWFHPVSAADNTRPPDIPE